MASSSPSPPLPLAPPPWTCKTKCWVPPLPTSSSTLIPTSKCFDSLEASSPSWTHPETAGAQVGGLGLVQILRYLDTPVGTYDELAIMPGHFATPLKVKEGGYGGRKHNRITGIWVSQEATCMNGRRNWNIPNWVLVVSRSHLARFNFKNLNDTPTSPIRVEVFDLDSKIPFFATTIHQTSWTPTFPFSSAWTAYMGLPSKCLHPPLPVGHPPEMEVGTDSWALCAPTLKSRKCRLVWLDMQQNQPAKDGVEDDGPPKAVPKESSADNWWPGMGRWKLGMSMDDATLEIGEPQVFKL